MKFAGSTIVPAAGKFIKTNGTGKLIIDISNSGAKLFPIGASYYNPVTITSHTGITDPMPAGVKYFVSRRCQAAQWCTPVFYTRAASISSH